MTDRVFISSTSEDLKDYREAAIDICNSLGLVPVGMEFFGAMGPAATASSLRRVEESAVYVGIIAHRYGYVEPGHTCSVTQAEYRHAYRCGLERLCFLMDPGHPWPLKYVDHEHYVALTDFKSEIQRDAVRALFTSVDDFRAKLTSSLVGWQRDRAARAGRARNRPRPDPQGDPSDTDHRNELIRLRLICEEIPLYMLLESYQSAVGQAALLDGLTSASAILDRLAGLMVESTAIPPVLLFAMWLERRAATDSQCANLGAWVDGAAQRRLLDAATVEEARAVIGRRESARQAADRLLVRIDDEHAPPALYSLAVGLHRGGGDVDPLPAADDDAYYSLDEVQTTVCASVGEWTRSCDPSETVIEFLVPRHLLDEAFDSWTVDDSISGPAPLGVLYGVMVRDLSRMKASEPNREWRRRWTLLNTSERSANAGALQWIDPASIVTVASFRAWLLREENRNWACLAFPQFSGGETDRQLLITGIDMGAPAILWLRTRPPGGDPTLADLQQQLAVTPLPRLPAKLLDLRREAEQRASTDHCGRFLALLWDDPDRIPPADRLLAAPTLKRG